MEDLHTMIILATIVSWILHIYQFLIFIRVLLSWINVDPYNRRLDHPLIQILNRITDPVLEPLRRIIPPIGGAIDVSPVVALIILEIVRQILIRILLS
jgi:YggT family protein